MGLTLESQYDALSWATRPDDPRAKKRFEAILAFMKSLAESEIFDYLTTSKRARVLDVMAASGIAGAALARALAERGVSVELYVADLRREELDLSRVWLAGVDRVEVKTVVADAAKLPEALPGEKFDVVLSWGSSMSHFDVYRLPLFVAGAKELGNVLIVARRPLDKLIQTHSPRRQHVVRAQRARLAQGLNDKTRLQDARAEVPGSLRDEALGGGAGGVLRVDLLRRRLGARLSRPALRRVQGHYRQAAEERAGLERARPNATGLKNFYF